MLPNRFLGVVGEHKFDVEEMAVSYDRNLLLSCSHDQCVKFWSVTDIHKEKIQPHKKARHATKSKRLGTTKKNNFFAGLEEDSKEEDDDDDDDDDSNDDDDSDEDSD